jgi:hypothetical protein
MQDLAAVLERFNRKERNLLVRHVLGHEDEPLLLSAKFLAEVASKLHIKLNNKGCWWATDYHINWLAGALAYYTEGQQCLGKARPNRDRPLDQPRLIEGNQEDIDLVIASNRDLIFIEAKAYGNWDDDQLQSKLDRLELLRYEYERIAAQEDVATRVQMHFLLISPPDSQPKKIAVNWRSWKEQESPIPWIDLKLSPTQPILEVSRCECGDFPKKSKLGNCWKIVEHRRRTKA